MNRDRERKLARETERGVKEREIPKKQFGPAGIVIKWRKL